MIAALRMVIVDTNIIAPLYVRSARTEAVAELFARDAVWRTETRKPTVPRRRNCRQLSTERPLR